jgi:hypothetical protein
VFCGAITRIEQHHVGGRNHASWFTLPLCVEHHRDITSALYAAGVDMKPARTKVERIGRALQALAVFLWWLGQELKK